MEYIEYLKSVLSKRTVIKCYVLDAILDLNSKADGL